MNKLMKRVCGGLATGAAAALLSLTAAPAAHATTVQPFTAHHCGSVWCVDVYGSGLHVDYEVVARAGGGSMSGYVSAQDDDDAWHKASAHISATGGSERLNIDHSFSNNSSFCGGISTTSDWTDYKSMVCFTIHS
jgi:hypothetical protein